MASEVMTMFWQLSSTLLFLHFTFRWAIEIVSSSQCLLKVTSAAVRCNHTTQITVSEVISALVPSLFFFLRKDNFSREMQMIIGSAFESIMI